MNSENEGKRRNIQVHMGENLKVIIECIHQKKSTDKKYTLKIDNGKLCVLWTID